MIRLDTIRALHDYGHELHCYCPACDRWGVLDLAALVAAGRGGACIIGWRPRCSRCGRPGRLQVRPPCLRPGPSGVPYAGTVAAGGAV